MTNGYFGIATENPTGLLHINGAGSTSNYALRITGNYSSNDSQIYATEHHMA